MGTEVYVNPLAVGRKVIVISGTVHHLMAGYGGGDVYKRQASENTGI